MITINYTIIIPHKNTPQLLQRCLDSIPIRDDVQVIVVDDNSDADKVDFNNFPRWKGRNYEYHLTKEGKGAGYARNIGIDHAKGEWLLFADADDEFVTQNLSILLNTPKYEYDVICWPTEIVQLDGNTSIYRYHLRAGHNLFESKTNGRNMLSPCKDPDMLFPLFEPWHKMCRRDLVRKHNIRYSEVPSCNDALFSVKLAMKAKSTGVFSDTVYRYIKRSKSLSDLEDLQVILQRTNELFRIQRLLLKAKKDYVLNGDFNWHIKLIESQSTACAALVCIKQMYKVSLRKGIANLKIVLLRKGMKAFMNFKFYCRQSPYAPDNYKTGLKRKVLNAIAAISTIFMLLYRRIYNFIVYKKYNYTLGIVAIAKNEGDYIQEWCAFHKAVGVDVIYLYDNESFDDMKEKLKPFINSGFVKYHYAEGQGIQMVVYKKAFSKHRKECKYLTFIDCDEFLYTNDGGKNLKQSVKTFFKKNLNTGGIAVNWRIFGDNGHATKPEGLCMEAFTKRALPGKRATRVIKTILRSDSVRFIETPHSSVYKWGFAAYDQTGTLVPWAHNPIKEYSSSPIRLNHYFCKSLEQYIKRKSIGDVLSPNLIRSVEEFHETNNNDVEDYAILAYLEETKQILANLCNTDTQKPL